MTESRVIETEAIVLAMVDARDDKIVRLLTSADELVPALVKHGRRMGKRVRASHVQPLSIARVVMRARPADDLAVLESAELEHPFALVKGDLLRLALGTCMAEVVLHLLPDWGTEPGLFALLNRALERLDKPERPSPDWLLLFELKALTLAGVLPPIEDLAEVSPAGRETLAGWLDGRWTSLDPRDSATLDRVFETLLTSASGRPFRSKPLLAEALR